MIMNLLIAFSLASIIAPLGIVHGLPSSGDNDEAGRLAPVLADASATDERHVSLRLDSTNDMVIFLAASPTSSGFGQSPFENLDQATEFVEKFKIEKDSLSRDQMEFLQGGGSLDALVKPVADFRMRDEVSGDIITVPAGEIDHGLRKLTASTLCGNTLARGLMSISFDGGDTSFLAKTSYSRFTPLANTSVDNALDVGDRKLYPDVGDVCEENDASFGACIIENKPCDAILSRFEMEEHTVCIDFFICIEFTISTTKTETKDFPGQCKSHVIPGFDDCECELIGPEGLAWKNRQPPPPQCTNDQCSGQGKGDPHFKTFDGTKYDYHGECDMVMTTSPGFASGSGLDLHIRTTIQNSYSYISAAALKIGSDVLEVYVEDGVTTVYFNGWVVQSDDVSIPEHIFGFPLHKKVLPHAQAYKLSLGHHEKLTISSFKNMLKVQVDAVLPDASGLLGTSGTPGLVGRNGTIILNEKEMGPEWQVRPGVHPTLFHRSRTPQFPQPCILPTASSVGRRLGENTALLRMAQIACAGVDEFNGKHECMFDVIQTGDPDLAIDYLYENAGMI